MYRFYLFGARTSIRLLWWAFWLRWNSVTTFSNTFGKSWRPGSILTHSSSCFQADFERQHMKLTKNLCWMYLDLMSTPKGYGWRLRQRRQHCTSYMHIYNYIYIYIYVMYMMHDSYGTSLTREWLMFFLRSHMAAAFVRVSPVRWPVRNGRFRATAHCYVDVMPNAIQVGVNRGVTSASETWLLVQWEDFFPKNIWLNGEWVESESLKVWKI